MTDGTGRAAIAVVGSTMIDLVAYTERIPDAYERLILDVMRGDKSLFIRNDELVASWSIYDKVLTEVENNRIRPEIYPYQSRGPAGADALTSKFGASWSPLSPVND